MAFIAKVNAAGQLYFLPSTDRQYNPDMLMKGQHEPLFNYLETRHDLPPQLASRARTSGARESSTMRPIRALLCLDCCDDKSWELDRDNALLMRHVQEQLTGLLELPQYQLTDCIQADAAWREGRSLIKLWLTNPNSYEA